MTLHYEDAGLRLFHGSNKDILPTLPDGSYDSIVTDPPYELSNDGKASPGRVLTEFMFPEKAQIVSKASSDLELPRLIAKILRLRDGRRVPTPSAAVPVGAVALDDHASIRDHDVEDRQERPVGVADDDALVGQESEPTEHLGCFQFELADSAKLLQILGEVGCGFQSGGIGVGLRVGSPGLPGLLSCCAAVVGGLEDVRSDDDPLARLVSAFATAGDGAVLSLRDLSGTSGEVISADGAFVFLSLSLLAGAVLVRATTGTRGLSTKLQPCRVRVVDDVTNRAVSFDLLVHPTSLSSVGFMGKEWDGSKIAYDVDLWRECLRVLKPGGFLLAFGGTRTWHRIAVAIEDAGFEIRDSIAWLQGAGFPKSHNVSRALDGSRCGLDSDERSVVSREDDGRPQPGMEGWRDVQEAEGELRRSEVRTVPRGSARGSWPICERCGKPMVPDGLGTALKPAFEPIVVARKPLAGTVAANVLAYGTGAINIDACRVPGAVPQVVQGGRKINGGRYNDSGDGEIRRELSDPHAAGRFPPNVLLDESQAAALDNQTGTLSSGLMPVGTPKRGKAAGILGEFKPQESTSATYGDSGGASRFFPIFRYEAKAPSSERPEVDGTVHATVKPLELMRWLIRLVTRPGGRVLDPFAGSGTTGEAALLEGMDVTLIELEADHLPLILQRVRKPLQPSMFGDWEDEEARS